MGARADRREATSYKILPCDAASSLRELISYPAACPTIHSSSLLEALFSFHIHELGQHGIHRIRPDVYVVLATVGHCGPRVLRCYECGCTCHAALPKNSLT